MNKKYLLLVPLLALQLNARGQAKTTQPSGTAAITGRTADTLGNPVGYATVLLLKAADSALEQGAMSSAAGAYRFSHLAPGRYILKSTCAGYRTACTPAFMLRAGQQLNAGVIRMHAAGVSLAALTVHADKPLFEQKIDRMIINVKSSPMAASETALDVLEKSPGVQVNRQDESISINGKDGVVLMINGKKQYMPINTFYHMLASMKASSIDRIELITTPPAKYDAEGNAGYINVVLAESPLMGFNGSYDLTLAYPYGQLPGADFNFNYRNRRLSLFGNLTFMRQRVKQRFGNERQVGPPEDLLVTRTADDRKAVTPYTIIRLGGDYQLDSSTSVGLELGGFDRHWSMDSRNHATIGTPEAVDTFIETDNTEINHLRNLTGNIHLEHEFTKQDKLTLNANYIYFKDNDPSHYDYAYYNGQRQWLYNTSAMSGKLTPIHFFVFAADYSGALGPRLTLETGAKYSVARFANDITVFHNGVLQPDMSADYAMKENIGALYASLSLELDSRTSLKGGLRYEHTTSELGTGGQAGIIDRKYGQLFPTFYISRKLGKDQTLQLSYSRRINRPSLDQLAPFSIFLDPTTFMTGNSALLPSVSSTAELSYMLKSLVIRGSYAYEAHSISAYNQVDIKANRQITTPVNLDHTRRISVSGSLPLTITPWWNMQNTATLNLVRTEAGFTGAPISRHAFDCGLNSVQDFTLPRGYALELKAFYYSPRLLGAGKSVGYQMLGVGGSKKFKDRSVLSFSVDDLLGPTGYAAVYKMAAQYYYVRRSFRFWTRNVAVTYSRSFGDKSLKMKKKWDTRSQEELNRVNH